MRSITCHLVYLISSFVSPANSVHRSRSFPMRNRDPSIYIRGFAVRASELSENLARFQELGLEEREGRILFFVLLTRRSHKDRGTVDERDQFRGPHAIYYVTRCGSFQKTSQRKRTAERNEQRIREGRRRERERGGERGRGGRGGERDTGPDVAFVIGPERDPRKDPASQIFCGLETVCVRAVHRSLRLLLAFLACEGTLRSPILHWSALSHVYISVHAKCGSKGQKKGLTEQ